MKIDGKKILERHEAHDDREKVSLYLSKSLYERFKKACKTAPASRVMEDLMAAFLESLKDANVGK